MSDDIVAALITKLQGLFGSGATAGTAADGDAFLSFLVPGMLVSPRDLALNVDGGQSMTPQEALNTASDLARTVNAVPRVADRWSPDGRMMWEVYDEVLSQALVAADSATQSEQQSLQRAMSYLYESPGTDSANLAAYQNYANLHAQAQIKYNAMRLDGVSAAELGAQGEQVNIAYGEWTANGFKHEVEAAFATIDQVTGRNPQLAWAQWKSQFRSAKLSDLRDQDFYQTYIYPPQFCRPGADQYWTRVTLEAGELAGGSANGLTTMAAPDALTSADGTVARLAIDVARVQIMRPWMSSGVFGSRSWRWPDARAPLSDGATPPKGSLPAYPTAMLLARNLVLELEPSSTQHVPTLAERAARGQLSLGPLSLASAAPDQGVNGLRSEGLQIIAFLCQRLPKSPDPDPMLTWGGPAVMDWLGGPVRLDPGAKITQVKVTIHTGDVSGGGTDANVAFRVGNGDWLDLDKPLYNDFEQNATDTYGPFSVDGLTAGKLASVPIELKHDNAWIGPGWYVDWVRLEVLVEGQGWLAYKQWQPGWLAQDEGDHSIYRKLQ
jgi:hypothetical protein